jgi:4-amino-4-deoxy-L-arabinose transferase-like glycosyltransferase
MMRVWIIDKAGGNINSLSQDGNGAQSFFPENGIYLWVLIVILFAGALAIRLYNVGSPPLDFHEVRQYHSLLIARSFYYASLDSVSETEKATVLAASPPLLEPSIVEYSASLLYRIFGSENLIIPRLTSIIFWLVSAVFLYLLARKLISPDAAVISISYFLFLPYGVRASRSFQPDPLMIMMFVAAAYSVFKYYKRPTTQMLTITCALSAIAVFVKPVSLFPLFGIFIAMRLSMKNIRKIILGRDMIIFVVASVIPIIIYSLYAYFIAGFMKDQEGRTFVPDLYMEPSYWKGWFRLASSTIGKWPLFLSLAGILIVRSGMKKSFLLGLWIGYIIFGLIFTIHISTHDYYHLILIPIVALSLGGAATVLLEWLASNRGIWRLGVWILFIFSILISFRSSVAWLNDTGFEARIMLDKQIGALVNHSANTLYLDSHNGTRLRFYGKIAGVQWPTRNDFAYIEMKGEPHAKGKELLEQIIKEKSPEYFIISSFEELEGQEDLKETLDNEYFIVVKTPYYFIYDLRKSKNNID